MIDAQLPDNLWGEAMMHTLWLKNRVWTRALPAGISPHELPNGNAPALDSVPVWGQIVWVRDVSSGKFGVRANEARWVGYDGTTDGHMIYWPEKQTVSVERNDTFSKGDLPAVFYSLPAEVWEE